MGSAGLFHPLAALQRQASEPQVEASLSLPPWHPLPILAPPPPLTPLSHSLGHTWALGLNLYAMEEAISYGAYWVLKSIQ